VSSFSVRSLEIWKSSRAALIQPIEGVFVFELAPTLMVEQTVNFLLEQRRKRDHPQTPDSLLYPFFVGMDWYSGGNDLMWAKNFQDASALFDFDLQVLFDAVGQLELHTDINLIFNRITYLVDLGRGPEVPLLQAGRLPLDRAIAFEVDERGLAANSIRQGDLVLSDKAKISQQHYSTGMALLAGEDSVRGLIDAAFIQFYLATESLLEKHDADKAVESGKSSYGTQFTNDLETIVRHVYQARHRFFGHAHPKFLKGVLNPDVAFAVAKQVLVARWCARFLMRLELKEDLVLREMRLYSADGASVVFNGEVATLGAVFPLPK
jgi:hypothetical protein